MERFYLEYHPDFYPFLKAIPSNLLILRLIRQKNCIIIHSILFTLNEARFILVFFAECQAIYRSLVFFWSDFMVSTIK